MLTMLDKARAKDEMGALLKWRVAAQLHADPVNEKPINPREIRELAQVLDITDQDALDALESDSLAYERVQRLQAGITILDESIAASLAPWKGSEAGLLKSIDAAKAEVDRLEGIQADVLSFQVTKGYEYGAILRAKAEAPRLYPSETL